MNRKVLSRVAEETRLTNLLMMYGLGMSSVGRRLRYLDWFAPISVPDNLLFVQLPSVRETVDEAVRATSVCDGVSHVLSSWSGCHHLDGKHAGLTLFFPDDGVAHRAFKQMDLSDVVKWDSAYLRSLCESTVVDNGRCDAEKFVEKARVLNEVALYAKAHPGGVTVLVGCRSMLGVAGALMRRAPEEHGCIQWQVCADALSDQSVKAGQLTELFGQRSRL